MPYHRRPDAVNQAADNRRSIPVLNAVFYNYFCVPVPAAVKCILKNTVWAGLIEIPVHQGMNEARGHARRLALPRRWGSLRIRRRRCRNYCLRLAGGAI